MSSPKVSVKVGKLSRTLAETSVPAAPSKKAKAPTEREQLAMARELRRKRQLPEIPVDTAEPSEE